MLINAHFEPFFTPKAVSPSIGIMQRAQMSYLRGDNIRKILSGYLGCHITVILFSYSARVCH